MFMTNMYVPLFFIPVFKWKKEYFVRSTLRWCGPDTGAGTEGAASADMRLRKILSSGPSAEGDFR